ncbi:unnamed protein product [Rotaria magnacalcarata]|uniref:Uncharacterized protein n=1 Tax=Rotaria magnacalcarata TaxID=392030 RepID=A0A818ZQP6_9BILA|nr:unnamed protein product [Rotaria magnacalcarata]CAF3781226.1 unnamed protein product [Rotaria magnacalcarata]
MRPIIEQLRTEIQAETSKLTAICTQLRTDAQTETKRVAAVCNLLRTELSKTTVERAEPLPLRIHEQWASDE